jgi:hypothetical protein
MPSQTHPYHHDSTNPDLDRPIVRTEHTPSTISQTINPNILENEKKQFFFFFEDPFDS